MTVPEVFLKFGTSNTSMFTTMNSDGKPERVRVITGVPRQRQWTPSEKLALLKETYQAVKSVSVVAREAGITASQLFQCRKTYTDGSLVAVGAKEPVVPASGMKKALMRIKQLEAAISVN